MSNIRIYQTGHVCLADKVAVMHGKNYDLTHKLFILRPVLGSFTYSLVVGVLCPVSGMAKVRSKGNCKENSLPLVIVLIG